VFAPAPVAAASASASAAASAATSSASAARNSAIAAADPEGARAPAALATASGHPSRHARVADAAAERSREAVPPPPPFGLLEPLSEAAADSSVGTSEARSARESLERAPEPAPLRSRTDDFERRVCAAKERACAGAEEEGERRASEAWWAEGRDVGER